MEKGFSTVIVAAPQPSVVLRARPSPVQIYTKLYRARGIYGSVVWLGWTVIPRVG